MFRECAKLENIGNLQVKLDDYRKANSKLNAGQKSKEIGSSINSGKLGNYLEILRCESLLQ